MSSNYLAFQQKFSNLAVGDQVMVRFDEKGSKRYPATLIHIAVPKDENFEKEEISCFVHGCFDIWGTGLTDTWVRFTDLRKATPEESRKFIVRELAQ